MTAPEWIWAFCYGASALWCLTWTAQPMDLDEFIEVALVIHATLAVWEVLRVPIKLATPTGLASALAAWRAVQSYGR